MHQVGDTHQERVLWPGQSDLDGVTQTLVTWAESVRPEVLYTLV